MRLSTVVVGVVLAHSLLSVTTVDTKAQELCPPLQIPGATPVAPREATPVAPGEATAVASPDATPIARPVVAGEATPVASPGSGFTCQIQISDFDFHPREVRISTGTTITWTNADESSHRV